MALDGTVVRVQCQLLQTQLRDVGEGRGEIEGQEGRVGEEGGEVREHQADEEVLKKQVLPA